LSFFTSSYTAAVSLVYPETTQYVRRPDGSSEQESFVREASNNADEDALSGVGGLLTLADDADASSPSAGTADLSPPSVGQRAVLSPLDDLADPYRDSPKPKNSMEFLRQSFQVRPCKP
jgi:hypothetical protein